MTFRLASYSSIQVSLITDTISDMLIGMSSKISQWYRFLALATEVYQLFLLLILLLFEFLLLLWKLMLHKKKIYKSRPPLPISFVNSFYIWLPYLEGYYWFSWLKVGKTVSSRWSTGCSNAIPLWPFLISYFKYHYHKEFHYSGYELSLPT